MITQGNNKKPDAAKLQEVLKPTAAGMEKIESLKDRRSKTVSAFTIFLPKFYSSRHRIVLHTLPSYLTQPTCCTVQPFGHDCRRCGMLSVGVSLLPLFKFCTICANEHVTRKNTSRISGICVSECPLSFAHHPDISVSTVSEHDWSSYLLLRCIWKTQVLQHLEAHAQQINILMCVHTRVYVRFLVYISVYMFAFVCEYVSHTGASSPPPHPFSEISFPAVKCTPTRYFRIFIRAYIQICIHTYIHACMNTCMHTYIQTYTHTCILHNTNSKQINVKYLST